MSGAPLEAAWTALTSASIELSRAAGELERADAKASRAGHDLRIDVVAAARLCRMLAEWVGELAGPGWR